MPLGLLISKQRSRSCLQGVGSRSQPHADENIIISCQVTELIQDLFAASFRRILLVFSELIIMAWPALSSLIYRAVRRLQIIHGDF